MNLRRWGTPAWVVCLLLLGRSAAAEHYKVLDGNTGQLLALADLNDPNLVLHVGATNKAYVRQLELDGPGYQCFQSVGTNGYVRWPLIAPGPMSFGVGTADGIAWSGLENRVEQFGLIPGIVTLRSRQVVPNPPLPPATVTCQNSHTQDLILGFVDLRKHESPPRAKEHMVVAGTSQQFLLDRDAGATIVSVYDEVLPTGETVERVERIPLPPQRIWDLVVWEYKVTYQVVGSPELDMKTRRSLAVLHLPAGTQMPAAIDVIREAQQANNPGEAALYAQPQP
jgi:hypothetical protein